MPTKPSHHCRWAALAPLAAALLANQAAQAQTDDTTPFYVGGSLGLAHVSNVYRESTATNNDRVTSVGLLGGIDKKLGRQHLTLDGSVQDNRYSENRDLNNLSYTLKGAVNWQTVGNLSGVLSAKSDRSLADFNIGNGVDPILKKNIEREDEYQALVRLGVATRYTLEAGWSHRRRDFSASEYDRFNFHQNTGSFGIYATPGANVRLGLAARHTRGQNPRYPVGFALDPETLQIVVVSAPNDYTRNDLDFTTKWSTGGRSTLNTRISRSKTHNSLDTRLRDLSGTTGSLGWNWQPTAKLQLNLQYARDTGQESLVQAADLNRVYTSQQLGGSYALTSKLSLSAKGSRNRSTRTNSTGAAVVDALDDFKTYNLGVRWAFSRGISLSCQYDHADRDNSVPQYVYSASSYGCTAQAILY
nr:outer membrane beta-barrel protein [Roseateles saccharophilus]